MDWHSIDTILAIDRLSWLTMDWQWIRDGLALNWYSIDEGFAPD